MHSLITALARYEDIRFVFISPPELVVPEYMKNGVIRRNRLTFAETDSLEQALPELDILYMTRVQRERFFNEADYIRLKDSYILEPSKLRAVKSDLCIMHPAARVS